MTELQMMQLLLRPLREILKKQICASRSYLEV